VANGSTPRRARRSKLKTLFSARPGGSFREPSWAKISATARGALLRKLADLIAAEADRLAEIETRDNGKLITEMRTQLRYIPQWFNYFGGLTDKIEGRVIPIDKPGMINYTREEPLRVVAAITPWNSR
jgi:(Z)-2-((N-methylformamido)methylene)-5-hydroxybutyrolactone dehydrogenase